MQGVPKNFSGLCEKTMRPTGAHGQQRSACQLRDEGEHRCRPARHRRTPGVPGQQEAAPRIRGLPRSAASATRPWDLGTSDRRTPRWLTGCAASRHRMRRVPTSEPTPSVHRRSPLRFARVAGETAVAEPKPRMSQRRRTSSARTPCRLDPVSLGQRQYPDLDTESSKVRARMISQWPWTRDDGRRAAQQGGRAVDSGASRTRTGWERNASSW